MSEICNLMRQLKKSASQFLKNPKVPPTVRLRGRIFLPACFRMVFREWGMVWWQGQPLLICYQCVLNKIYSPWSLVGWRAVRSSASVIKLKWLNVNDQFCHSAATCNLLNHPKCTLANTAQGWHGDMLPHSGLCALSAMWPVWQTIHGSRSDI